MDPFNFKIANTTTDLYYKIYCKSLDSMPLILALLEHKFPPTGTF